MMEKLVHAIDTAPGWDGYTFDPGAMIASVNRLRQRSAAEVFEAMRRHSGGVFEHTRVMLLLRVLFVPIEAVSSFPPLRVGAADDVESPLRLRFPTYPLALVENVPLLIAPSFHLAGDPEDSGVHIEFCETSARLRAAPLHPPDDPLDLADLLVESDDWYRPKEWRERDLAVLRAQLLRLVNSVLGAPEAAQGDFFVRLEGGGDWAEYCDAFRQRNAVWDADSDRYLVN